MARGLLASHALALLLAAGAEAAKGNLTCLMWRGNGCHSTRDEQACVSSRDGGVFKTFDGLRIQGEPCVWCGGKPCTSKNDNLCEPYDWLVNGLGRAFPSYTPGFTPSVAHCEDGHTMGATLAAVGPIAAPLLPNDPEDAFVAVDGGDGRSCRGSSPLDDGQVFAGNAAKRSYQIWTASSVEECKAICKSSQDCKGVEYKASDRYCEVWYAPVSFSAPNAGYQCFSFQAKALCKNNAACSALSGLCCPTKEGLRLGCCGPEKAAALSLSAAPQSPAPSVGVVQGQYAPMGVVHATVGSKEAGWKPVRPTQDETHCLVWASSGCGKIKDRSTCLSSRDGRDAKSFEGLKIQGEPCVWCGGGICHSNNGNMCEPYDYLVNGEGTAYNTLHARANLRVAQCKAGVPTPQPPEQLTCLNTVPQGCSALREMGQCLNSRDGRDISTFQGLRVQGEPCVWCGGGLCHSGGDTLCEPFDLVMNGEGRVYDTFHARGTYKIAGCEGGLSAPSPMDPQSCLRPVNQGCSAVRDRGTCLNSRDGRDMETFAGLRVRGEPCVWCGGGVCHSSNNTLCEPLDYLMRGEGRVFNTFHARGVEKVANCQVKVEKPQPKPELTCLRAETSGCNNVRDMSKCLSSYDGRDIPDIKGLKVGGEPCVWCGGGLCHSDSNNLCEPFDYLLNGEGKVFNTFHARGTFRVAACQADNHPLSYSSQVHVQLPTPSPPWRLPRPTEGEMTCLRRNPKGCSALRDERSCLGSRDASGIVSLSALQVQDEPCVWCGGGICTSNDDSMCLPYRFLMYGEMRAFVTFHARGSYGIASCGEDGLLKPVGLPLSPGIPSEPLPASVEQELKGSSTPGQRPTAPPFPGTIDAPSADGIQQDYARCGGDGWRGATKCKPGAACHLSAGAAFPVCMPAPPPGPSPLQNEGRNCWEPCQSKAGFCEWCGAGNACCRQGYSDSDPAECRRAASFFVGGYHHECVMVTAEGASPTLLPVPAGAPSSTQVPHDFPLMEPATPPAAPIVAPLSPTVAPAPLPPTVAPLSPLSPLVAPLFPTNVPAPLSPTVVPLSPTVAPLSPTVAPATPLPPVPVPLTPLATTLAPAAPPVPVASTVAPGTPAPIMPLASTVAPPFPTLPGPADKSVPVWIVPSVGEVVAPGSIPTLAPVTPTTVATTTSQATTASSFSSTPASSSSTTASSSITTTASSTSTSASTSSTAASTSGTATTTASTTAASTTASTTAASTTAASTTASTTASTASSTTMAGSSSSTSSIKVLTDEGCLAQCGGKDGFCALCGIGNACCRPGKPNTSPECQGPVIFVGTVAECVTPAPGTTKPNKAADPWAKDIVAPLPMSKASYLMKVSNVDFMRLQLDPLAMGAFEFAVKDSVASAAREGAKPSDVSVSLVPPLSVQAFITSQGPNTARSMETRLCGSSSTLSSSLQKSLGDLPGFSSMATGPIVVESQGLDSSRLCPREESGVSLMWFWMTAALLLLCCIAAPLAGLWFERQRSKGHQRLWRRCTLEGVCEGSSSEEDTEAPLMKRDQSPPASSSSFASSGLSTLQSRSVSTTQHMPYQALEMQPMAPVAQSSLQYQQQAPAQSVQYLSQAPLQSAQFFSQAPAVHYQAQELAPMSSANLVTRASGVLPATASSLQMPMEPIAGMAGGGLPPTTSVLPAMPMAAQSMQGYGDYDLVTVTPQGLQVHHLHGAAPPPGVPIVAGATVPMGMPIWEDNA